MEETKQAQSQLPTLPPHPNKRPLPNDSPSFKIRALLKNTRPHFLEVLRTPDFRSCKAAREIQEQMKLLMELCEQLTAENQPLRGESRDDPKARENVTMDHHPKSNNLFAKPSVGPEKQRAEDGLASGSYIVGGSAFGWNFITFTSNDSIYYGVTKESFLAARSSVSVE